MPLLQMQLRYPGLQSRQPVRARSCTISARSQDFDPNRTARRARNQLWRTGRMRELMDPRLFLAAVRVRSDTSQRCEQSARSGFCPSPYYKNRIACNIGNTLSTEPVTGIWQRRISCFRIGRGEDVYGETREGARPRRRVCALHRGVSPGGVCHRRQKYSPIQGSFAAVMPRDDRGENS